MHTPLSKQEAIEEITRRIVEHYHPVRVYLFGSEARGDAGPDSDLDFMVVLPDDTPDSTMRFDDIHRVLAGVGLPKDVVPWRMGDFEIRSAYVPTSLPATVIREGRLLYDAA
jgi:predicted nucleotidyltransferase